MGGLTVELVSDESGSTAYYHFIYSLLSIDNTIRYQSAQVIVRHSCKSENGFLFSFSRSGTTKAKVLADSRSVKLRSRQDCAT